METVTLSVQLLYLILDEAHDKESSVVSANPLKKKDDKLEKEIAGQTKGKNSNTILSFSI